jgi:DNA polymerase III subunit gamma/tau
VLEKIDAVWRHGLEMKRFYSDLLAFFHHTALLKLGEKAMALVDLPGHDIRQMQSMVRDVSDTFLTQLLDLLFQIEPAIKLSSQPKLALEMAFIKLFQSPPAVSVDSLIERLDQLRSATSSQACGSIHPSGTGESAQQERNRQDDPLQMSTHDPERVNTADAPVPADAVESRYAPAQQGNSDFWDRFVRQVNEDKPSLGAFLSKCRASFSNEGHLELEVTGNEFTFKNVQKNADYLERACSSVAGRPIRLILKSNCEDDRDKRKEKMKNDQLKQKALSDPLVMQALELFQGKIVDVKIP